jgi:nucleotide-binding universal stress UspA family protein
MKVLIGVDDSPHARVTLGFVRKMAWPEGTRMRVVTALTSEGMPFGAYEPSAAVRSAGMVEEIRELQESLVARGQRDLVDAGLDAEGRVIEGDPCPALLREAEQFGADLLVVGSHGHSGIERLLMGSVATQVVANARCSVLVVRERVVQ